MTTPDLKQNTVFIVAPERCDVGKDIRWRRQEAVRVATIETWWDAEAKGYIEYIRHCLECAQCQDFELSKRGERWAVIEQQETK